MQSCTCEDCGSYKLNASTGNLPECSDCGWTPEDDGKCDFCHDIGTTYVWTYEGGGEDGGVNGPWRVCYEHLLRMREDEDHDVIKEERIPTDNHCRPLEERLIIGLPIKDDQK